MKKKLYNIKYITENKVYYLFINIYTFLNYILVILFYIIII